MTKHTDYRSEAKSDAAETCRNFADEIVEALVDSGEASDDLLNDYPNGDSYHHESHTDRDYNLTEAAELLDTLDDYEETDSGLWEGLEPRRAIAAQAAYTYGNAVYAMFQEIIEEINGDDDLSDLMTEHAAAAEREDAGDDWVSAETREAVSDALGREVPDADILAAIDAHDGETIGDMKAELDRLTECFEDGAGKLTGLSAKIESISIAIAAREVKPSEAPRSADAVKAAILARVNEIIEDNDPA